MLRILVIDDDALVRRSLNVLLRDLGHEPVLTAGTIEGLEQAEGSRFDIALIDMNMPGPDGLEAVKALAHLTPPITVIGMSGGSLNLDIDYSVLALRMGAQSFLRKPFTREQLATTIASAVR